MSNIIFISGTPCTGKTTISENLSEKLNWELVKINDLAISNEMDLRNTVYNMIHFVELKGTYC